ncbi:MAG: 2-hydroxy-3-oxopropionate reductase, partial [Bacteroidales bacterium]|nr:2-hydroxy-3-oxopropionate reductase [Bacteroidales bacterium]
MAKNLVRKGYSLIVFDIKPEPVAELVEMGAKSGCSPADVASKSDIVITMLPNSPHVVSVISGKDGVLEGLAAGKLIIDMSSISPVISRKMAALAAEKGIEFLDAPVSGGEPKAIDG